MKKLLLCGVAAAAVSVAAESPAFAAPPPAYNWTGCYVGGNVGHGRATKDFFPDFTAQGAGPAEMSSTVYGGQFGCDYQAGMWLFGAQGLFDWASMRGNSPFVAGKGYTTHISWFDTITGRVGFLPAPNFLVFFRGGIGFVHDHHERVENNGMFIDAVANVTRSGPALGGGAEWMFFPNWSVAVEYIDIDLGTRFVNFQGVNGFPSFSNRVEQHMRAVLVSINYRFGTWGR